MLTHEDVKILTKPFAFDQHFFNYEGFCYVGEGAVADRLDEVDPCWEFKILSTQHRSLESAQGTVMVCEVHAQLIVKGVVRENFGQQVAYRVKSGKGGEVENTELVKGATTDAFRRCARMFGIGRYLLKLSARGEDAKAELKRIIADHYATSVSAKSAKPKAATTADGVKSDTAGSNTPSASSAVAEKADGGGSEESFERNIEYEKTIPAAMLRNNADVQDYFKKVCELLEITQREIDIYRGGKRLSEIVGTMYGIIEDILVGREEGMIFND